MKKNILFTGGGTAGHVVPNLAMIEKCIDHANIFYIGSKTGIEKELIQNQGIPYYAITTGKLRRYFSFKTILEPFKVLLGIMQAYFKLFKIKPAVIFSKGGYVAFPVVVAGWLHRIPVIVHESDFSPGLANQLSFPFAHKICMTFPMQSIKNKKFILTGAPLRESLFSGVCKLKLDNKKKTILIYGGGSGSRVINQVIYQSLAELTQEFNVIHLCGRGNYDKNFESINDYYQIEYADQDLKDLMACADLVISRAGSNSLYELLALKKLHLLIPLSKKYSRGDQIQNAAYFKKKGCSEVLLEEDLTKISLINAVHNMFFNQQQYFQKLDQENIQSGTDQLVKLLYLVGHE